MKLDLGLDADAGRVQRRVWYKYSVSTRGHTRLWCRSCCDPITDGF